MSRSSVYVFLLAIFFGCSCSKGDGWNSLTAETEQLKVGPGPEDFVVDTEAGRKRLLVSCDERRADFPPFGEILSIEIPKGEAVVMKRTGEPEGLPFFPHGVFLLAQGADRFLYAVNHHKDGRNTNTVLMYRITGNELKFVRMYADSLMISPNDLCVLPDGSFYFSNDKGGEDLIAENLFNKFGGSVVYCPAEGACKYADQQLAFPNGLEYRDGQLFVATTRQNALFRYTVEQDGSLSGKTRINNINGMDNLMWDGTDLLVAVHPNEIAFVGHSFNQKVKSPGEIYRIHPQTGAAQRVFRDDGSRISAGATGAIEDGYLYISQVFEDYVLRVKL